VPARQTRAVRQPRRADASRFRWWPTALSQNAVSISSWREDRRSRRSDRLAVETAADHAEQRVGSSSALIVAVGGGVSTES
jgi:hypothetical protein